MIDDPEIEAIARARRMTTLERTAVAAGIVVVVAVFPSGSSVTTALEAEGYSDVEVARAGLFGFMFKGTKGRGECSGSTTKMPGSSTIGSLFQRR